MPPWVSIGWCTCLPTVYLGVYLCLPTVYLGVYLCLPGYRAPESLSSLLFLLFPVIGSREPLFSLLFPVIGLPRASLPFPVSLLARSQPPTIYPFHCWARSQSPFITRFTVGFVLRQALPPPIGRHLEVPSSRCPLSCSRRWLLLLMSDMHVPGP